MKRISIDPITRLEGHGKIDIFLNDEGDVANAYLQIPELRGFEKFCLGRPAEDMPNLTARICGVCPEAHHMAATKALDALFHVDPPPTAKLRQTGWRVGRSIRSEDAAHLVRTLEDAPFYARSLVAAKLLGEPVMLMHESLSLDRFRMPVVRT